MKTFYLILINLAVVFVGLFIHGSPPKHYYLVIYPIPIILVAYFLSKLSTKLILLIIFMFGVYSIWHMASSGWYKSNKPYLYNNVKNITDKILKDAKGEEFSLQRVGEFDYFENNFANNYIYLLKLDGAKVTVSAKVKYTIYENENNQTYFKKE